jgi:hypothetical protein
LAPQDRTKLPSSWSKPLAHTSSQISSRTLRQIRQEVGRLRRDLWICRPQMGKLWVGEFRAETSPAGPGADHRLPPIVVYNNINLKWNLGSFCQKTSNINGLCHIPPLKV